MVGFCPPLQYCPNLDSAVVSLERLWCFFHGTTIYKNHHKIPRLRPKNPPWKIFLPSASFRFTHHWKFSLQASASISVDLRQAVIYSNPWRIHGAGRKMLTFIWVNLDGIHMVNLTIFLAAPLGSVMGKSITILQYYHDPRHHLVEELFQEASATSTVNATSQPSLIMTDV